MPPLLPLSPAQLTVLRVHAALTATAAFAILLVPILLLLRDLFPVAAIAALTTLIAAAAYATLVPPRRFRSWGYAVTDDELHVAYGLWIRIRTAVPFGRVQHLDVAQGPLQRRYGVATLVLHTAGTRAATVALPGLDRADAERLRDEIRRKIRAELG